MRLNFARILAIASLTSFTLFAIPLARSQETYGRNVMGRVVGSHDEPVAGATITIKNTQRGTSEHVYSDPHGEFLIAPLSTEAPYEVFAEYKGERSQTEHFDKASTGKIIHMTLKVPTGQPATHDNQESHDRAIVGWVVDARSQVVTDADVVLKNAQTGVTDRVRSDHEGAFRFMHLSTRTTYEIYAEKGGVRSDSRTVSKNDHHKTVEMRLKLSR
jgi:hypothetical protein